MAEPRSSFEADQPSSVIGIACAPASAICVYESKLGAGVPFSWLPTNAETDLVLFSLL